MWAAARTLVLGLASYVPGLHAVLRRGTGGTTSARYCYAVWLRHLVKATEAGLNHVPERVAELGPGDSLGIGLSALLCGAETYTALDAVPHARNHRNLQVFDELTELFSQRAPIPGPQEFPGVKPALDNLEFPSHVLTEKVMAVALNPDRVSGLRDDLAQLGERPNGAIRDVAPWAQSDPKLSGQFDLIMSQAVLEHVDDISGAYAAMAERLASGGIMTHQIDFRSHGTSSRWNGHLAYSDGVWALMRRRLPYLLNRTVYSDRKSYLEQYGLRPALEVLVEQTDGIPREALAPKFRKATELDLRVSGAFIVSRLA